MTRLSLTIAALLVLSPLARAGLHYSGETTAELPSRWRGFLIDHRSLRSAGFEKPGNLPPSPLRDDYLAAAKKLEQAATTRLLTADELADLGALYVRLGRSEKAVELLRPAARQFPDHFRIAANLGTAWQLAGDLEQAAIHLEDAVRLAPESLREAERYHLKLVRLRLKEGRAAAKPEAVDDLFGVKYVGESGSPEPGKIAASEMKKLPPNAAAIIQQLALWLPADGRLLWQAGELANAYGDVRTAGAILDGCVTEFGMLSPDLRKRRPIYRAAADELAKIPDHDQHRGTLAFKSPRPLLKTLDESTLPPIRPDRPTPLGWRVLGATVLGEGKPAFPKYLDRLDGKPVTMLGYMQPVGRETRAGGFLLLEYPVGCWFCETPEPTGLLSVELKTGTQVELRKGLVKVTGTLGLNRDDPESFLFHITDATVSAPE
ncbi:MAG TPA: tetratricopeptide repeat protein [Gemmataceae bacterium]|nr:tetratricopeptide repeat protein [Gemmataceae bacterium]